MTRYFVQTLLAGKLGHFPIGTLVINIFGCLFIGLFMGHFFGKWTATSELARIFFAVGFCGGFSTLATFSIETLTLFQNGNIFSAVFNIIATFSTGLIACAAGFYLMRNI